MQKRYKHIIFPSNPVAKSVAVIAGNTVVKDIVIVQAGIDKVGDYMDNEFINGIVAQGNAAPTGIKCRGGHPNMCKDSLGTYIGDYHNFRAIEQDGLYKAVADLYIAEIAKKTMIEGHGISYHDYVVEMAKNHPDKLGNSIVFTANSEYVKQEDGTEYYKLSLVQFRASDIVDSPAATDGLFKSDDDIGVKLTEFLDDNPEVLEAISKNENAIEIFFKKYANQKAAEYGADLVRKQSRTHYWESVARGIGSIAAGAGNFIGAFRPGANIFRNDYGPRNTTIYNGR